MAADDGLSFDFESALENNLLTTGAGEDHNVPFADLTAEELGQQPGNYKKNFRMTVCTYWLRGLCMKGDACGFLHQFDPERMPVCRALLKFGECKEPDCPYKHSTDDIKECNMYKLGFCIYGSACRYKHRRLDAPVPEPETVEAAKPREQRNVNAVLNQSNPGLSNKHDEWVQRDSWAHRDKRPRFLPRGGASGDGGPGGGWGGGGGGWGGGRGGGGGGGGGAGAGGGGPPMQGPRQPAVPPPRPPPGDPPPLASSSAKPSGGESGAGAGDSDTRWGDQGGESNGHASGSHHDGGQHSFRRPSQGDGGGGRGPDNSHEAHFDASHMPPITAPPGGPHPGGGPGAAGMPPITAPPGGQHHGSGGGPGGGGGGGLGMPPMMPPLSGFHPGMHPPPFGMMPPPHGMPFMDPAFMDPGMFSGFYGPPRF